MSDMGDNVVPRQRKHSTSTSDSFSSFPGSVDTALPALMARASIAAKQMRYFRLAAKSLSFSELLASAMRAGFTQLNADTQRKEATFQWSVGDPDLVFSVSFGEAARASIVAESSRDIIGLTLTCYSHAPCISVETNPLLINGELGHNALLFRDILLIFPDFDDLPAWSKYWQAGSEPRTSTPGTFRQEGPYDFVARFRSGGVTAASAMYRTWKLICSKRGGRFSLPAFALFISGKLRFAPTDKRTWRDV